MAATHTSMHHPANLGGIILLILTSLMAPLSTGCSASTSRTLQPSPDDPLSGQWLMEINSNDIGYVRTVMTIERSGERFEGESRRGAANDILGWWELLMAKLFTDYFEHGAILHLKNGRMVPAPHGFNLEATLISALGPLKLQGTLDSGKLSGVLTRKGSIQGRFIGVRTTPTLPLDNYPAIVERALLLTEEKIYNKRVVQEKQWSSFKADLLELATQSQDDLDLIFGFFHYGDDLPFSHYNLYRKTDDPALENVSDGDTNARMTLKSLPGNVAHLVIRSFSGEGKEIDEIFERIIKENPSTLIVDLRGNTGGNISAMRVVSNLIERPLYGGVFVTNKWFEKNSAPPTVEQYSEFQSLTEANVDLLFKGIHERDGISLMVLPAAQPYRGKLFVLTNKFTASSCEPLVYGIKQYGLGTVVGQKTAGAMLNGEEFPMSDGWYLTIPTAEYYAADGYRIDGVGVAPDIEVESAAALDYVLKNLSR